MCKEKINQVDLNTDFDISEIDIDKNEPTENQRRDLKLDPTKYSTEIQVKLEKCVKDIFEIGMLSITNKRAKDEVANTTYSTIIANWKKKEKEEVRTFNELLNKVVLDKIDTFKTEVVNLFDVI